MRMGNDEFILYVRKWNPTCSLTNDELGRKIWLRILELDSTARQIELDKPCIWGITAGNKLPKTAAQFGFKGSILVPLYSYLDRL